MGVWPSPAGSSPLVFFNDTATTEIYTLSLHDALPICSTSSAIRVDAHRRGSPVSLCSYRRSEEHTSELQSRPHLVCRLLLEKKIVWRHLLQQIAQELGSRDPSRLGEAG